MHPMHNWNVTIFNSIKSAFCVNAKINKYTNPIRFVGFTHWMNVWKVHLKWKWISKKNKRSEQATKKKDESENNRYVNNPRNEGNYRVLSTFVTTKIDTKWATKQKKKVQMCKCHLG